MDARRDERAVESPGPAPGLRVLCDEPPELLDRWGRLRVRPALRHFRDPRAAPLVLITGRDLAQPPFHSLLGYSDRRRRIALVSTCRLGEDARGQARLANLIAHECGHLRGLRHCGTPGCLMHPARTPADLDGRSTRPCGACPAGSALPGLLLAAILLLLLFSGLDRIVAWASPAHRPPFGWSSDSAATTLLFEGRPVFRLRGSLPEAERRSAAERLNAAFLQLSPVATAAVATGSGRAAIDWRGAHLIEFSQGQTGGADAYGSAHRWSRQLNELLRGKGTRTQVCPTCHIDRVGEVEQAKRSRGR